MATLPGFDVAETVTELTAAVTASGAYGVQNIGTADVFYASSPSPPAADLAWRICSPREWFRFDVGPGEDPVWVQCQSGRTSTLSIGPIG